MYSNKLIACVKAGGKVLREQGDNVFLPFGSEYTLWFKNEHTRKAQIKVEIDGTDVLFNRALILNPGETTDLKGFVRDMLGNDNRAFKFITKTQEISDFRGDKIEDGLIKISFQFEKALITKFDVVEHHHHHHHRDVWNYPSYGPYYGPRWDGNYLVGQAYTSNAGEVKSSDLFNQKFGSTLNNSVTTANATFSATSANAVATSANVSMDSSTLRSANINTVMQQSFAPASDPGITVEGSNTNQSFHQGYIGQLEAEKHSIVFQLKGLVEEEQVAVAAPVTVKSKKQCPSCGKKWKSIFEYCPNDGTFLRFPQE